VWIGAVFLYIIAWIATFALKAYMALGALTEFSSVKLLSKFTERFYFPVTEMSSNKSSKLSPLGADCRKTQFLFLPLLYGLKTRET
jgi:hypothetical protein